MTLLSAVIALGLGIAFGVILQRVQASSPDRIVSTLRLEDLTILKFMILAIGVGAVGIGLLTTLGVAHLEVKGLPLFAVAAGGAIFGVGFATGGYCPGTCLVGAAEGRRDALFTIAGGIAGAAVYALFHPTAARQALGQLDYGQATLATASGVPPGTMGVVFGAAMIALSLRLPTRPGRTPEGASPS